MTGQHWTIEGLPWADLSPGKVDPDLLSIMKAAALVEYNAREYADYLCRVFRDDAEFQAQARRWAEEEVRHGEALGAWAEKVDPSWSLDRAMARFRAGYKIEHFANDNSVRGSRAGELVARCMVEVGTSSYYTAIAGGTEEPVLRQIARNIAGDEFRHYKLFYDYLGKYVERDGLGKIARLKIALGRIAESEDDELAYAYYAANAAENEPYNREKFSNAYLGRASRYYRKPEIDRMVSMVFKACGLKPHSAAWRVASAVAWWKFERDAKRMQKAAA